MHQIGLQMCRTSCWRFRNNSGKSITSNWHGLPQRRTWKQLLILQGEAFSKICDFDTVTNWMIRFFTVNSFSHTCRRWIPCAWAVYSFYLSLSHPFVADITSKLIYQEGERKAFGGTTKESDRASFLEGQSESCIAGGGESFQSTGINPIWEHCNRKRELGI